VRGRESVIHTRDHCDSSYKSYEGPPWIALVWYEFSPSAPSAQGVGWQTAHLAAEVVQHQRLVRLHQTQLPRQAAVLDGGVPERDHPIRGRW
jgi:hypothetical protein